MTIIDIFKLIYITYSLKIQGMKFRFEDDFPTKQEQQDTKIQSQAQNSLILNGESNVLFQKYYYSQAHHDGPQGNVESSMVKNQLKLMLDMCKDEIEKQMKVQTLLKKEIQVLSLNQSTKIAGSMQQDQSCQENKAIRQKAQAEIFQKSSQLQVSTHLYNQKTKSKHLNTRSIKSQLLSRGYPSVHKTKQIQTNKNKLPFRLKTNL